MHPLLTKPVDWLALQSARRSVNTGARQCDQETQVARLLEHPDFFCDKVASPNLQFESANAFRFRSALDSSWSENDTVHGKLYRVPGDWTARPTVILLHGWNAEMAHRFLFPWLARRCVAGQMNVATIELPYHAQRKPRGSNPRINFMTDDLVRLLEGTRQALADIRALMAWLSGHGCRNVGLWGFSMGAWLGGLIACRDLQVDFAVLTTPVVEMDRAMRELQFCRPIHESLKTLPTNIQSLNLISHQPKLPRNRILIVEALYDCFAPPETIEAVWRAWEEPVLWRVPQGHITILMSLPILVRTVNWIRAAATSARTESSSAERPENTSGRPNTRGDTSETQTRLISKSKTPC